MVKFVPLKPIKMKSSLLKLILMLALLAAPRVIFPQGYQFGIFVDPQLAWFSSDTKKFTANGSVLGYDIGFAGEKYFAQRYAMLFGLSLESLGGNLKYNEMGYSLITRDGTFPVAANSTVEYEGQYINTPIGLKFRTVEIGYLRIFAQVALKGHFKLKGFVWEKSGGIEREVVTNDQVHWAFASYSIGAGLEYSLGGPSAIQTGIQFSNSFTPVYKAGHGHIGAASLSLRVGLVF